MTVEEGLRSQLRNIETTYGRSIEQWIELIRSTGARRHGEIVTWLKSEHGLAHGAANRVALVALDRLMPKPESADPTESLYAGSKASLLPVHEQVMTVVHDLGPDVEVAPRKGYLSLRRRKQFGMIKPAAKHIDVGLNLPGRAVSERLESAATFNALFTHGVRVQSVDEIDDELVAWVSEAYRLAA
jgi:hypothetical protein